jgi:hypothetical protein
MVQIENEIGRLEDTRDYSNEANILFNEQAPESLMKYLNKNKETLHPQILKKWSGNGCKMKGGWQGIFGNDIFTNEIFMAWSYAQYIGKMAQTARSIHNVPFS